MQQHKVSFAIRTLNNQINRFTNHSMENLSGSQLSIIAFVLQESPQRDIFQKDIEAEFHISRSSVTLMLQRMERSGLIERQFVPWDARLKKIIVTPKAQELYNAMYQDFNALEDRISACMTPEEQETFFHLAQKIMNNMEDMEESSELQHQ